MTGRRTWSDPGWPPVAAETDIGCAGTDPEIFFPTPAGNQHTTTTYQAIRICRRCPHVDACLEWAVGTGQDYGIWGGTTAAQRRQLSTRRAA
jgi:WhiB family redox-sensing transcriptional regulator